MAWSRPAWLQQPRLYLVLLLLAQAFVYARAGDTAKYWPHDEIAKIIDPPFGPVGWDDEHAEDGHPDTNFSALPLT